MIFSTYKNMSHFLRPDVCDDRFVWMHTSPPPAIIVMVYGTVNYMWTCPLMWCSTTETAGHGDRSNKIFYTEWWLMREGHVLPKAFWKVVLSNWKCNNNYSKSLYLLIFVIRSLFQCIEFYMMSFSVSKRTDGWF